MVLKSSADILADMDATLDQLIRNAEVLRSVSIKSLEEKEIEALQKTQDSLLAHLVHMDQLLNKEKVTSSLPQREVNLAIKQKISHFGKLHTRLLKNVSMRLGVPKRPRVGRNRKNP